MRLLPRRSGMISVLSSSMRTKPGGIAARRAVEPVRAAGRHHARTARPRSARDRPSVMRSISLTIEPADRPRPDRAPRAAAMVVISVLAVRRHDSLPRPVYHAASNCRPSWPAIATSRMTPGLDRRRKPHRRELLGAADAAALGQHAAARADLAVEMAAQRRLALLAQAPGALLDDVARDLRHARGRRAGPRRERKDVQLRQPAFVDQIERAREHRPRSRSGSRR